VHPATGIRTPLFWIAVCCIARFSRSLVALDQTQNDLVEPHLLGEPDMRKDLLLETMPPGPVESLRELYAIAFDLAQQAAERYGVLAARTGETFRPISAVFAPLAARQRDRAIQLSAACVANCGRPPDIADLRWPPVDLVPTSEISDIWNSGLATPYAAWALAARQRQRAFVFWTYVIALADDPLVRSTGEALAHEALSDCTAVRRERRLAWRVARNAGPEGTMPTPGKPEPGSAALLESLLLKDMIELSQRLGPAQRRFLLSVDATPLPATFSASTDQDGTDAGDLDIEQLRIRTLRRAEQLSNIYLDDADRAVDQDTMELSQKLAERSIIRLASLQHLASEPG
jgi:hypothetical protein